MVNLTSLTMAEFALPLSKSRAYNSPLTALNASFSQIIASHQIFDYSSKVLFVNPVLIWSASIIQSTGSINPLIWALYFSWVCRSVGGGRSTKEAGFLPYFSILYCYIILCFIDIFNLLAAASPRSQNRRVALTWPWGFTTPGNCFCVRVELIGGSM